MPGKWRSVDLSKLIGLIKTEQIERAISTLRVPPTDLSKFHQAAGFYAGLDWVLGVIEEGQEEADRRSRSL